MFTRGFKVEKIIRALLRGKGSRRGVTPTKPTVPNMAAEQPCRIRSTVVKTPIRRPWLRGFVRGDDITATCFITRWRLFDLLEAFFFVLVYFLLDVSGMLYRRFIFHVLETVVNVLQIQRRQYFTGWRGWGVGGGCFFQYFETSLHYSCASTLVLFLEASWQGDPVCIHLPLWSQYLVTYPANWDK